MIWEGLVFGLSIVLIVLILCFLTREDFYISAIVYEFVFSFSNLKEYFRAKHSIVKKYLTLEDYVIDRDRGAITEYILYPAWTIDGGTHFALMKYNGTNLVFITDLWPLIHYM